jgi:hypothetical protein
MAVIKVDDEVVFNGPDAVIPEGMRRFCTTVLHDECRASLGTSAPRTASLSCCS